METKDKFENYPYKKDGLPVFFVHLEAWGQTLAVGAVLVSDLNYAVNEFSDGTIAPNGIPEDREPGRVVINAGISKLHPHDRYNRAVGREVSMGRMKQTYAWISRAMINSKGITYVIQISDSNITVSLMAKHGEDLAYPVGGYCLH